MKSAASRTICPFCTLGCEIGAGNDRGRFWNDYPPAGFNKGRVCPRGSLAARLLDHEMRLAYPLKENREIGWREAVNEITGRLKKFKGEEIAVTFDKNLTIEEFDLVSGLAQNLGVSTFASSYLEPEHCFNQVLGAASVAGPEEITESDAVLLVGDVFGQSPVVARFVLDARYKHRDRRIIAIDSLRSYTLGFGDVQMFVDPGSEPFALAGLITALQDPKKDITEFCSQAGIDDGSVRGAAGFLAKAKSAVILSVMSAGKTIHPLAQALLPLLLVRALEGRIKYTPLAESFGFPGSVEFGKLQARIKSREIKALLNFGDFFPFFYPQLSSDLAGLDFMLTTSTMRPPTCRLPMVTLPVASNLEKSGTIVTSFGPGAITPLAEPVSGARTIADVVEGLAQGLSINIETAPRKKRRPAPSKETSQEQISLDGVMKSVSPRKKPGRETLLLGEKTAFDFLGILGEPTLKISPVLMKELGVLAGESVVVEGQGQKVEIKIDVSVKVRDNHISVSAELPHIRALFPLDFQTRNGGPVIAPTGARLWKRE